MACDFSQLEQSRFGTNHAPMAALAIVFALLLGLQTIGCGGSAGMQQPPAPPPPPESQFTTIDAPGAGGTTPEGTFGIGIDANGDIVGYFIDSNNALHGFLRDSTGAEFSVDAPGAGTQQNLGTEAAGINASGEIAGFFFDTQGVEHSFVRTSDGTFTTFDPPNSTSGAQSINDGGTVAGGFVDANGAHGYLRAPDGTFTAFDPTGNATQVRIVIPNQINASGVVAGDFFDTNTVSHGFVRDANGTLTLFDVPGAGTTSGAGTQAFDINSGGVIVGAVTTGFMAGEATSHSFIRNTDGSLTTFDPPTAGAIGSIALGINDSGAIIGSFVDANLVRHGYLRNPDGSFVVLDDPNAAQLAISFTNLDTVPRRINASGTIAGLYSDTAGIRHAFILE